MKSELRDINSEFWLFFLVIVNLYLTIWTFFFFLQLQVYSNLDLFSTQLWGYVMLFWLLFLGKTVWIVKYNFIILKSWVFFPWQLQLYISTIQILLQLRVYISQFRFVFLAIERLHCAILTSFLRIGKLEIVSFKIRIARYKFAIKKKIPLASVKLISQFGLFLTIASLHRVAPS